MTPPRGNDAQVEPAGGGDVLGLAAKAPDRAALRFPERTLSYAELAACSRAIAAEIVGADRVAVWAESKLEAAIAIVAAIEAGVPAALFNPRAGVRELAHILADSDPDLVLVAASTTDLPDFGRPVVAVDPATAPGRAVPGRDPGPADTALIVYTSGTTGPPKGVLLPRRAVAANLDALARAWQWTEADVVGHALPLFHVHGLVLGILGPLRRGGTARHLGRFDPSAVAEALREDVTTLFGVPTMYRRLAEAGEENLEVAEALRRARLLVSGSAPLPAAEHERIERLTGQRVVERYGMTETLMIASVRADGDRRAGYVGVPLDGVEVRMVDDAGGTIEESDDATIGEIEIRGPNLFSGYLNRADATEEAMRDGWFRTGDLATRAGDGYLRIVGRRATDLIKSGGYKIGAGEIEAALREHPRVSDVAVTGEPDDDLGERIVAWVVVTEGEDLRPGELGDHVAELLAPHKRPRVVRFLPELPRNELGKVQKKRLGAG